ncbi:MAG: hypothetical protein KAR17_11405, partial [Cyclobacteriaceae bacterium]|nr:hypothetical protein [Cyclobacteriaceae bacterium]
TLSATPQGGIWEGAIINQNQFDPVNTPGDYTLTYITQKGDALCERSVQKTISLKPIPQINFIDPPSKMCHADNPVLLAVNVDLATTSESGFSSSIPSAVTKTGTFDPGESGVYVDGVEIIYTAVESVSTLKCSNSETIKIQVNPMPVVDFVTSEIEHLCLDSIVYMENLTTIEHDQSLTHTWTTSDGPPNTDGKNASIVFVSDGDKTIKLRAISEHGCAGEIEKKITISKAINPDFAIDFDNLPVSECGPITLGFKNNTINKYEDEINFMWDFGNGITSTLENPGPVTFNQSLFQDTLFYVSLSTNNQCGGSLARDTVKLKPNPKADFIFEMDTVCADYPMEFYNKSYGILSGDSDKMFYWDFDDGSTRNVKDSSIFTHSFRNLYNKDTTYTIRLIAQNSCKTDTLNKALVVIPKAVKAAFEVSNVSGCQPFTVNFE